MLIESVRTEKGSRYLTVMHLGELELGKNRYYQSEIEERYTGLKKHFMINIVEDKSKQGYATDVIFTQIPVFDVDINDDDPLIGTYVIESTFTEKSAEEIWLLYMTLTRVEAAFRSMKTDLGTRLIYHQIARRTEGHLFISVLAYHLLINIEHRLLKVMISVNGK